MKTVWRSRPRKKAKAPIVADQARSIEPRRAFISGLMARKTRFIIAELGPDVDPFMLHIYAAVAQKEDALISQRRQRWLRPASAA